MTGVTGVGGACTVWGGACVEVGGAETGTGSSTMNRLVRFSSGFHWWAWRLCWNVWWWWWWVGGSSLREGLWNVLALLGAERSEHSNIIDIRSFFSSFGGMFSTVSTVFCSLPSLFDIVGGVASGLFKSWLPWQSCCPAADDGPPRKSPKPSSI